MTNEKSDLAIATIRGTFWTYASNYGGKILSFIATTILAWLLTQEDFGVAGYALVAINFLDVLSTLGIGSAVIYHREEPEAADTAFWLSMVAGGVFFAATWVAAPYIGAFFNDIRAIPLVRALASTFIISSLSTIHSSLLAKKLHFGRKFIPELARSAAKGLISILLAWMGFGAWSLVLGQIGGLLIAVIAYWIVLPWRPSWRFSLPLARSFLSYGSRIIFINFLGVLHLNMDYLLIGRFMTAAALGVYTLAFRVPELLIKRFSGIVAGVIFPVYAQLQESEQELTKAFQITLRYVSLITVPMGVGLALVAEPLILTVFSAKWEAAIPVMRAIAIYSLLRAITFNVGDILKAQGRLDVQIALSTFRAGITIPALWWAIQRWGTIVAVGWAQVALAVISTGLNLLIAHYLIGVSLKALLSAFQPAFISGGLMTLAVLGTIYALPIASHLLMLVVAIIVGASTYLIVLWQLQPTMFQEVRRMLQRAIQGEKRASRSVD